MIEVDHRFSFIFSLNLVLLFEIVNEIVRRLIFMCETRNVRLNGNHFEVASFYVCEQNNKLGKNILVIFICSQVNVPRLSGKRVDPMYAGAGSYRKTHILM